MVKVSIWAICHYSGYDYSKVEHLVSFLFVYDAESWGVWQDNKLVITTFCSQSSSLLAIEKCTRKCTTFVIFHR